MLSGEVPAGGVRAILEQVRKTALAADRAGPRFEPGDLAGIAARLAEFQLRGS